MHFIAALCEVAKQQKRVTATEKDVPSERFTFRIFLLKLGFAGAQYADERNGEVSEVEVSDELGETLVDLNRQEYNNDHKETRRHVLMSVVTEEQGMEFQDERVDVEALALAMVENACLRKAIKHLSPDQRALIHSVFVEGRSIASIASDDQVRVQAVHARLSRIYKKLCKLLS